MSESPRYAPATPEQRTYEVLTCVASATRIGLYGFPEAEFYPNLSVTGVVAFSNPPEGRASARLIRTNRVVEAIEIIANNSPVLASLSGDKRRYEGSVSIWGHQIRITRDRLRILHTVAKNFWAREETLPEQNLRVLDPAVTKIKMVYIPPTR
jgi:hypothetical protein